MPGNIIQDVVIRIALQQVEAQLKAPNIQPAAAELKKIEAASAEATRKIQATHREVEKAHQQSIQAIDESVEAHKRHAISADRVRTAQVTVANQLKESARGALQLGRGIAFMAASSDEDFQKMLRTIAKFQGAFDIFRGGINVIEGLVKAQMAYRTATLASAAANTAFIASLGPIALAIGAVAVVAGGTVLAINQLSEAEDDAAEATKAHTEAIKEQVRIAEIAEQMAVSRREALLAVFQAGGDLLEPVSRLRPPGAQVRALEQRREALRAEIDRQRNQRSLEEGLVGIRAGDQLLSPDVTAETIKERLRTELGLEKQLLGVEERIAQVKRQSLESDLAVLDAQRQTLEAEHQRLQSLESTIGRLTPAQRAEVDRINQRAAAGPLSDPEVRRLEQLLGRFAAEFATAHFAAAGRAAGGADLVSAIVKGIDPGERSDKIAREIAEIERRATQADEQIEQIGDAIQDRLIAISERLLVLDAKIREGTRNDDASALPD